jgi:tetrahydromethanopterin S-methyltransferase subunit B
MSTRSSKTKGKAAAGESGGPNIYVGLLFVSLMALILGIIFLVMELSSYNWELGG